MRVCSKADLQVVILHSARVTREKKYATSENCKDLCIALFNSVLVFIIPHSIRDIIPLPGHIPGIANAYGN